ncbi:hypothetical protein [Photobacterium damselae]|uniref:Uncharacterized protein n=1 Tax=Photobacterium damselae subsp. damselae TaxID=85581 RepID=A0AAD3WXR2_PHODD|nr:hypothetical protein [Photobacterium damselae]AWK84529.1 hypothetical protein BST98_21075 [Photobacterium damselae]KAB1179919.1 hypothetical protein F6450_12100 [Photobacterium damselae subsp. damselae]MBE8127803.1 hypothetical protein [Photobacterium damselae subsp. piscicida]MCG3823455.1 hypothetical protein [Photobacterium damselae]NVO60203.1 hypothetical protein [Photobacterium damselae subsp. damselae]
MKHVNICHIEKLNEYGALIISDIAELDNGFEVILNAQYLCCNRLTSDLLADKENGYESVSCRKVEIDELPFELQAKLNRVFQFSGYVSVTDTYH